MLHDFIGKRLTQPRELEDARLTTHQLVCVARAIEQPEQPRWIWEAVLALNRLRNRVSHDLESHDINPAELTKGQEAFTKLVASNSRYPVSQRVAHLSDFDQAVRAVYIEILEKVHPTASLGDGRVESDQA